MRSSTRPPRRTDRQRHPGALRAPSCSPPMRSARSPSRSSWEWCGCARACTTGAGESGSRSPALAASTSLCWRVCWCWVGSQPRRPGTRSGPPRRALPRSRAWCGFSPPITCSFPCIARCGRAELKYSRSLSRAYKKTPEPPAPVAAKTRSCVSCPDSEVRRRSGGAKQQTRDAGRHGRRLAFFGGKIHMARTRAGFIRILTISTVAAFAGLPFVASAQQPDQGIQEIIVTATKREANLQDVPFSVSATSQDQNRNSGAMDLVDLARNIVGFAVADLGPGQSQVAIRGISSGQVIRDQPGVKEQVGVYLDESPISVALFTPDLELFDLDRFEVLRGPQGTLFGAGSESGTVRYITHQPQLGKTEVSLDASLETVSHGDEGGYLRAALNLPVTDVVAARLVGYWHHLRVFDDAITPIGPIGANSPSGFNVQKSINDGDRSGVRLAFLVKPSADLSITPRIMFQKLETNGYPRTDLYNILGNSYTATQPPVSIGSLQQYRQQHDGMIDDFTLADLKVDYDTGPGTLTSITSFTHRNVLVARDATQLTGSVTFDVFGNVFTPNNAAGVRTNSPLFDRTHLNVLSQEVRLASNGKQMIDWLVGGFFQHVGRRYGQNLPTPGYDALNASFGFWPGCPTPPGPPCSFPLGNDTLGPADTPFFSDLSYRLKQYAAFCEGTWHATDQIAVTAGLRYYKFNSDRVPNFHR